MYSGIRNLLKSTYSILHMSWSLGTMVWGSVCVSKIISIIARTFFPINMDMFLCFLVPQPMKAHVPEFGAALVYVVVYITKSCGVIYFYRYR